jgi:hypothetical protein
VDGSSRALNYEASPAPARRLPSETKSLFLETAKALTAYCELEPRLPPKERKKKGDGRALFLGAKSIIRLPTRLIRHSAHAFSEAARAITAPLPDWLSQFLADDEPGGAACDNMRTDPRYRDWYGGSVTDPGLSSDSGGPSLDL